jgi:CelD/BcsL family acetyltransferase involved in cellulose biosynthesis
VPFIDLGDAGMDGWMAGKSASFRREMRRKARRSEEAGGEIRLATEETLEDDVASFLRLHLSRLSGQGGSDLSVEGVEPFLVAAGRELLPAGRFRLIVLEIEGRAAAAQLMVGAGTELSAWNSGFDEAFADLSPSQLTILRGISEAFEAGAGTISLGPGGQAYKYRLANRDEVLARTLILPRSGAYALRRAGLLPRQARRWAAERAPERLRAKRSAGTGGG